MVGLVESDSKCEPSALCRLHTQYACADVGAGGQCENGKASKAPVQGGWVKLALVRELLEEPGLDESAPPCHHCRTPMITHAPVSLQHPIPQIRCPNQNRKQDKVQARRWK